MIRINLLAPMSASARHVRTAQQPAAIGLAMLLVTAAVTGSVWYRLHAQRAALDARVATDEAELANLKQVETLLTSATGRQDGLREQLALIERLRGGKRAPANLLETLSRSLPDGLWLLQVEQSGATVQVDGRATSLTAVSDFAEQLQNSHFFDQPVQILTTSTETVGDVSVIRFLLKATPMPAPAGPVASVPRTGR